MEKPATRRWKNIIEQFKGLEGTTNQIDTRNREREREKTCTHRYKQLKKYNHRRYIILEKER